MRLFINFVEVLTFSVTETLHLYSLKCDHVQVNLNVKLLFLVENLIFEGYESRNCLADEKKKS